VYRTVDSAVEELASDAEALDRVNRVLGPVDVAADLSFPHGEARVLQVRTRGDEHAIVKWHRTSRDFHRELSAYQHYVPALGGDAPRLIASDDRLQLLLISLVPGAVVEGTEAEHDPAVHARAGELLRRLHEATPPVVNDHFGDTLLGKLAYWVDRVGEAASETEIDIVRRIALTSHDLGPLPHVPAHRDFSSRNWMLGPDEHVRLIDFGSMEFEPWAVDLLRLQQREWLDAPLLREAFLDGYGRRPDERDAAVLHAFHAVSAIATIAWARQHHDPTAAAQGRQMLDRLLGETLY
jgi:aminoglycoside/choline kinase family phosphotransferase